MGSSTTLLSQEAIGASPERFDAAAESSLIRAAQRGSKPAAEKLARRYWHDAYKAALLITGSREDAEDVAQDALVSALRNIGRFRRGRRFEPWLHRIVVNRALDVARSSSRRRRLQEDLANAGASPLADQTEEPDERLIAAIDALPLDQRVVVVMRHGLGYETNEIARILKAPRGTIGSRLRRALDQLDHDLGGTDESD